MMNSMGGEDDLPDLDGADDVRSINVIFTNKKRMIKQTIFGVSNVLVLKQPLH